MSVSGKLAAGLVSGAVMVLLTGGAAGSASAAGDGHLYGAFAVSTENSGGDTAIGISWNAPDQGTADRIAMQTCGYRNCWIAVRYMDGCAALAERDGLYLGGVGATTDDASRAALGSFGPPRPASLSSQPSQARVVDTQCNG